MRLLPLLVPLGVVAWMAFTRRWVADDAYINFRVVDNLFAGHGPVFNAGERVEVATSTVWLGILAGLALLLPDAAPLPVAAVAAGLTLTLVGLAAAQAGAVVLAPGWGRTGVAVPAGVLVLAALPPVWDFATSGLENGLTMAWLGGCFLALALRSSALRSHAEPAPAYRPVWLAVLVGLGPLIRPDFAVLSLAFGIALLATSRRSAASWLGGGATALVLPVGYQLFRMGFYATLVPNTALAKSATSSQWEQGLTYLGDFAGLYWLVLPLAALLLAVLGPHISARWTRGDRATVVVLVAPVVGGLVHAAYVIRVGGDFMHGRLLLPATMAIVLPVAAVVVAPWPPDRSVRTLIPGAVALVAAWALVVGTSVRVPYAAIGPNGVANERGFYVGAAGRDNPVTLEDYRDWIWVQVGDDRRQLAATGGDVVVLEDGRRVPAPPGTGVVAVWPFVGMFSVSAGTDVHVADRLALGEPVGARLVDPNFANEPAGHQKLAPDAWMLGRFASPTGDPETEAAQQALGCGTLRELVEATTEPLTVSRFLRNMAAAPRLTALRIPVAPSAARTAFCPVS
ncbi:MAG: hypothetical protein KY452_08125 [Actinobacteria bacterium]|nr:hypothetical protein [Actinomycetota bacterium]